MGVNEYAEPTDAQLIETSLTQPDAFTGLFERHAGPVHRYIVKRVGPGDAEDLVGETFATAFRSRKAYDLSFPDARPWLFGIATNHARHFWRSESRRQRKDYATAAVEVYEDPSDDTLSSVFFQGQAAPIAQALGQLDDAYLDVLLLVAGPPGFSYEEVSIALGIPVGTVRSRLSRARRLLRELLGDSRQYLGEESPTEQASIATEGLP